jgi:hypothetical protein
VPGAELVARQVVGDPSCTHGDDEQRAHSGYSQRRLARERTGRRRHEGYRREPDETEGRPRLPDEEGRHDGKDDPAEKRPASAERRAVEAAGVSGDEPRRPSDEDRPTSEPVERTW